MYGIEVSLLTLSQVTVNTLAIRHMMRPFKPGDRLIDHAMPIREVMQQLQTQLAEYKALKEHLAGVTGAVGTASSFSDPLVHEPNSGSNASSSSSSFA